MKPLSVMLSMLVIGITSSAAMAEGVNLPNANLPNASLPNVSPANSELVNRGAYIARAADCMACHGEDYTGGTAIETPMGEIYSTNITPSKRYGIGDYTETDLKNALQKGRAPSHMLYPAMPYPSYSGMKEEDISALFAYLQTVPAVDEAPKHKTNLPFPFNIRSLMLGWNFLNVPSTEKRDGLNETQKRGEYLVNNLEHCGTCHTPRNSTMGFDKKMYLSGAQLGHWHAPNITPDESSGIGSWSEQDIITYLRTGELDQRAYAGGPMGEVSAVDVSRLPTPVNESITHDLLAQKDYLAQAKTEASNGSNSPESLYLAACGSCHGVDGYGQPDARYAPIVGLSSIRREKPDALVNMILHGVEGATDTSPIMPGFSEELNSEQIAGIANYVRVNFGGLANSEVSAADVDRIANTGVDKPFLIKYAGLLAIIGILVAIAVIIFIIRAILGSKRRR